MHVKQNQAPEWRWKRRVFQLLLLWNHSKWFRWKSSDPWQLWIPIHPHHYWSKHPMARENQYILHLTLVCATAWTSAIANNWILRYDLPQIIHSDRDRTSAALYGNKCYHLSLFMALKRQLIIRKETLSSKELIEPEGSPDCLAKRMVHCMILYKILRT